MLIATLAACQPDPTERLANAKEFLATSSYPPAIVELKNVVRAEPGNTEARLLLADATYIVADFETSATQYERLLALGDDRADVWFGLGRALISSGRAVEAMEIVFPNLSASASRGEHYALMGNMMLALGNNENARELFQQAIAIEPLSSEGNVGLAVVAALGGDSNLASRILDNAMAENSQSEILWRAKGNLLQSSRYFGPSVQAYRESIRLEKADTPHAGKFQTRANLVSVLIDDMRFADANDALRELRNLFPRHPSLSYLAGRIAFGRDDFELAQREFQNFLAANPEDPHAQAMMGVVSFREQNYGQAEMWLTRAIRAEVGGESIRRLLGETKLRLNRPRDALEILKAAESEGQRDAVLMGLLGRAEIGVGDTESAIRYFEESLRLDPENSLVGIALAATYMEAGRFEDGNDVLESLPDEGSLLYYRKALLIGSLLRSRDHESAIAEVDSMLAADPNDPLLQAIAGSMWQSLGDFGKARGHFELVIAMDPENVAGLYNLGRLDLAEGDFESAVSRFKEALDTSPSFLPALKGLVVTAPSAGIDEDLRPRIIAAIESNPAAFVPQQLLVRHSLSQGRLNDAVKEVGELRASFSGDPRVDHLHGVVLLSANRFDEALQMLTQAAAADDGNPEFLFDLATGRFLNEQYSEATSAFQRFRRLQPDDERGLAMLGRSAIASGRAAEVLSEVRDSVPQTATNPRTLMVLGDLELAAGNNANALVAYEKAAELDWNGRVAIQVSIARSAAGVENSSYPVGRWLEDNPDDDEARRMYARLLETDGQVDAAVAQYEELLKRDAADPVTLNNLAWQYFQQGRTEALDLVRRASELAPEDASITDTLGWVLLEQGNTEEAVRALTLAVEQSEHNPEIEYHLAVALLRSGQRDKAKEIFARILAAVEPFPSRSDAEQLAATL